MKLTVMYRAQCFAAAAGYGPEYDVENINVPTLIISISDTDTPILNILAEHAKENPNIVHIEFLQFDDIDCAEEIHGLKPMDEDDAVAIVDAFEKYWGTVDQIIVHCDAGYSRSPAVAAAIAKAMGKSDEVYFSSGEYCPNRHVYRTLLNIFVERGYFDRKGLYE